MFDFNAFQIELQIYLLIFARIVSLILVSPLFSNRNIPTIVKVTFALAISYLMLGVLKKELNYSLLGDVDFIMMALGEVVIGVSIGIFINAMWSVFSSAAQMFSVQMGLGAAQVYNPMTDDQSSVLSVLFDSIAVVIFFSGMGIYKFFVIGIRNSFLALKVSELINVKDGFLTLFMDVLSKFFVISLTLSLPILATLILVSISFGLISKAAPQMNLLMLGFPISLLIGFFVIFIFSNSIIETMNSIFDYIFNSLNEIFVKIKGLKT